MWVPLLIAAFYCLPAALTSSIEDCPGDLPKDKYLHAYNDKCYYFYLNKGVDYRDAKDKCYVRNGRLAMVKSKDINDFLLTTLRGSLSQEISSHSYLPNKDLWIGLTDAPYEGEYRWTDGTLMNYQNFESSEGPDGLLLVRGFQDCVALNPYNGKWHDYRCESSLFFFNERRPFICEYEADEEALRTTFPTPVTKTSSQTSTTPQASTEVTTTPMTTTTATTRITTTPKETCPTIICPLDCGLRGYKVNSLTGCSMCDCED